MRFGHKNKPASAVPTVCGCLSVHTTPLFFHSSTKKIDIKEHSFLKYNRLLKKDIDLYTKEGLISISINVIVNYTQYLKKCRENIFIYTLQHFLYVVIKKILTILLLSIKKYY